MSKFQKGIINRYYEHRDTIMLDRLGQIVSDLYLSGSGKTTDKLWDTARDALAKTPANPVRVAKLLKERDIKALAQLVGELQVPDSTRPTAGPATSPGNSVSGQTPATPPASGSPGQTPVSPAAAGMAGGAAATSSGAESGPTPEDLKMALKAFRKRLKLTRLDEESKLGRSPLSGGKKSQVVAIIPPSQFPRKVWEELARQGKLKGTSGGFYELVGE